MKALPAVKTIFMKMMEGEGMGAGTKRLPDEKAGGDSKASLFPFISLR